MKALVVFFTVFIICLFGWFGGRIRQRRDPAPSKRLVLVNGLIARNHDEGEDDWGYRKF